MLFSELKKHRAMAPELLAGGCNDTLLLFSWERDFLSFNIQYSIEANRSLPTK